MKRRIRKVICDGIGLKMALSLISVFVSISSCTAKCPSKDGVDDDTYLSSAKPKKVMPPQSVLKKIAKSDKVWAYTINALSDDSLSEKVCGFSTIGQPKELTASQIEKLKSVILNDSSYIKKDNIVKYSTFLPDYAMKFQSGKDSVVVFMDFHADLWSFKYKKKDYLLDNDAVSPKLRSLVGEIFNIKIKDAKEMKAAENAFQNGQAQQNEAGESPKADSVKYRKLAANIESIVNDADSVYCFILDPLTADNTERRLGKYAILQEKKVDEKTISLLRKKLLGKESFPDMEYVKNCTFLPDVAFVFCRGNDRLNVLFSFYCNECQMVLNDKLDFQNECGTIQSDIIKLAKKVFPKDKYLRTISK